MNIHVLRLGHRIGRDPRITSHLALVARALGADAFHLAGDPDDGVARTLDSVNRRFGGAMTVDHVGNGLAWLRAFVNRGGTGIHLTMYGLPYRSALGDVDVDGPVVFVVGGAKVPAEVFELCAHNIAVGNQPHSEVAALALCLDRWNGHVDVTRDRFEGGELQILPSDGGKVVVDVDASESE